MDQYIGRLLDNRYEILEVIGTGGMAVVYKALCHRLNRLVAIKILKDEFAGDEEFRRRFHAEGEAVAMLSHPNIVQVYDVSSSDNANYIVMELIDGISLKQYMEMKGVLNWKETLHFAMQIAKGLEHAHSRGIVHRDIKPHNIMVLKNGSVKVMDFGIARVMNKSNTLTKEALGSVHYISPEQAKGGYTDNRSDIYSLGVVMYEMMTGRPPYDGESAVAVAIQHINGGAPAPSTLNPNIPGGMEQIIMKSMALDVRDRYASATEMLHDMEEFRKNPAILFENHTMMDDATRILPRTGEEVRNTGRIPQRAPSDSMRLRTSTNTGTVRRTTGVVPVTADRENEVRRRAAQSQAAQQQRRKEQERSRRKEEHSRVATTAIVICSAVAVFAILMFLVALFNGALLGQEKNLVDVPYLEGRYYDAEMFSTEFSDFNIRLKPRQYSEAYREDQIIEQTPAGGSQVQKGTDIWLTISMGPEPPVKLMDNLVGVDAEQAKATLEERYTVYIRQETHQTLLAGQVIRTDPAEGAELTDGQTVYLFVSIGPEVIMAKMPDVIGMDHERAMESLRQAGFENIRDEEVESARPKGEVTYQSISKFTETEITTEVVIHYSAGPAPTEETGETGESEATEETAEPTPVTLSVTFKVPKRDAEYNLELRRQDNGVSAANVQVPAESESITVPLQGYGMVIFEMYINGEYSGEMQVGFPNG